MKRYGIIACAAGLLGTALCMSNAHAASLTALVNFDIANGELPTGSLIADTEGNLYGTTAGGAGGPYGYGAVFKLTPPDTGESAWKSKVIASFDAPKGYFPNGGLISDRAGNLYGTTRNGGGVEQAGTVFELTPPAAGKKNWTLKDLKDFDITGGRGPNAGLLADIAGNIFGTTAAGGADNDGVVFELTPPAAGRTLWTETVLTSFQGTNGEAPNGGLIADSAGNLYGTTVEGGLHSGGTVFKLTPPATGGKIWTTTVIVSFDGSNGAYPYAGLIADSSGNLYGTTCGGGTSNLGTVFKLTPPAEGKKAWTNTVLTSFNATNGACPQAGLTADSAGNLYGTTMNGGVSKACSSCGTAFKLSPPLAGKKAWKTFVLASFGLKNGAYPTDSLIADSAGNLYGTSVFGGASKACTLNGVPGCGVVFKLQP